MIKLFVLDIDGCISHPFQSPDWEAISEIRRLNLLSRTQEEIPSLTLCTGRPFPYAEAVAQWLEIRQPFVFESSLLYDPVDHRVQLPFDDSSGKEREADDVTRQTDDSKRHNGQPVVPEALSRFRTWLTDELLPEHPGAMLEFSKLMDAGVVSNDKEVIERIYQRILRVTQKYYPELEVHRTDASVNTILAGNNKEAGFRQLCRELSLSHSEMAYIGDSEADVEPLRQVKMPFAPANAIPAAHQVAESLPQEATRAVLEAYRQIIAANRQGQ